jgi:hypothetical protein
MRDANLILDLRDDVHAHLSEIADLVEHAAADDGATGRAVRSDAASLASLELLVTVVAPMSAGKSTLINAVAGADLLPARAAPMTTLPTRVVLDPQVPAPVLRLTAADVGVLGQIVAEVTAVQDREPLAGEAHLRRELEDLAAGRAEAWREAYEGTATIERVLKRVNDLMRIAELLYPSSRPAQRLGRALTLHAPYPAAAGDTGRVVLVDTPGVDDLLVRERFAGAVTEQIAQAHVVVVVLDFTVMSRGADDDVRNLVLPAVRNLGGDRIFAVVNKVDQRQPEHDLDAEGVATWVSRHLGVAAEHRDHIVETRAREALLASRLLSRINAEGGALDVRNDPAVRAFLSEIYRDEFARDEQLRRATVEDLAETARRMWTRSGVPVMVDRIVGKARSTLLSGLLEAVLRRTGGRLADVADAVRAETARAEEAAQTAAAETEALDRELAEIRAAVAALSRPRTVAAAVEQSMADAHARANAAIDLCRGNKKGFKSKSKAKDFASSKMELPRHQLGVILDETRGVAVTAVARATDAGFAAMRAVDGPLRRAAAHLGQEMPTVEDGAALLPVVSLGWVGPGDCWDAYTTTDTWGDDETRYESDLSYARTKLTRAFDQAMAELARHTRPAAAEADKRVAACLDAAEALLTDHAKALSADHDVRVAAVAAQRRQVIEAGRATLAAVEGHREQLAAWVDLLAGAAR